MFSGSASRAMTARMPWRGGWDSSAVAGNTTLTKKSGHWQKIDPNGAGRDVTLPAVTPQDDGDWFFIANAADAAEALTVKDAGGATIGTVSQSEAGIVYVDSAGAWQLFGVLTYAAS